MLKAEYTDDDARKAVAAMTLARAVFARGHTSEAQVLADGIDALRKRAMLLEQQRDEARRENRDEVERFRSRLRLAEGRVEEHRRLEEAARAAGLTLDGMRQVLEAADSGKVSVSRLYGLVLAAARAMARVDIERAQERVEQTERTCEAYVEQARDERDAAREAATVAEDRAEWHRSLVGGSTWWRP